jgi:hypothetical protein
VVVCAILILSFCLAHGAKKSIRRAPFFGFQLKIYFKTPRKTEPPLKTQTKPNIYPLLQPKNHNVEPCTLVKNNHKTHSLRRHAKQTKNQTQPKKQPEK